VISGALTTSAAGARAASEQRTLSVGADRRAIRKIIRQPAFERGQVSPRVAGGGRRRISAHFTSLTIDRHRASGRAATAPAAGPAVRAGRETSSPKPITARDGGLAMQFAHTNCTADRCGLATRLGPAPEVCVSCPTTTRVGRTGGKRTARRLPSPVKKKQMPASTCAISTGSELCDRMR